MKILSIECSSVSASTAITDGDKLVGEGFANVGLTHSQTLMPMVESLLKSTNTDINSLDAFAVSVGPGSFTGVRIGVAAVKGLADASEKPCIAVSSLEAIAYPFSDFDGVVCSVMDARCNQVYTACFENGKRLSEDDAILIDELKLRLQALNKRILLSGDGAEMVYNKLKDEIDNIHLSPSQLRFARASSVCYVADKSVENGGKTVTAKELLPMYLRLPQAQRELNNKNAKLKGE